MPILDFQRVERTDDLQTDSFSISSRSGGQLVAGFENATANHGENLFRHALCRGHPQYAAAGPALHPVFRPPEPRHSPEPQEAGWQHYLDEITRDPVPLSFRKDGIVAGCRAPGRVAAGDLVAVVVSDIAE
ncbi:MAG: hypothetical protein JOZ40_23170 [Methylobacteriaceae bacterium]|nr:hypothetical protein [Methylobacteriaceae bacterium]